MATVGTLINRAYDMEQSWNDGGKKWTYEYKFRRGGKALCALYAKENRIGFMVIFGKAEREKLEANRSAYLPELLRTYDAAQTYHDGKWVMSEPDDAALFPAYMRLLQIKRKPNKKESALL